MALIQLAGLAYPYSKLGKGIPENAVGAAVYDSNLLCLLRTNQRSRVMRPALGVIINQLVFENTGPFLQSRIAQTIVEGVNEWIPGMIINFINIKESDTLVSVWVGYTVQGVSSVVGPIPFGRT